MKQCVSCTFPTRNPDAICDVCAEGMGRKFRVRAREIAEQKRGKKKAGISETTSVRRFPFRPFRGLDAA